MTTWMVEWMYWFAWVVAPSFALLVFLALGFIIGRAKCQQWRRDHA